MELKKIDFSVVDKFENKVSEFFGAKYGIAVDSCTHGIELCLRHTNSTDITCPTRCYPSIPMLASKLKIKLSWIDTDWYDYYYVTPNIIDAAVLWKKNSYIPHTYMCLSFQYQKHLSVGRGGMILIDNYDSYNILKKMSYDGRIPGVPWREQDIDTMGYHYYMTPETAQHGLNRLDEAINTKPKQWSDKDYPDISKMKIFKNMWSI